MRGRGKKLKGLAALLCTSALTALSSATLPAAYGTTEQITPNGQVTLTGMDALALAQRLFADGETAEAENILRTLRTSDPAKVDHYQVAFLAGLIAAKREDYQDAENIFRQILGDKPDLVRVRLELAKVLFATRQDQSAAYHFRLALANGLGSEATKIIHVYLSEIEKRKVFHISFSAGLAPSTNINNGTQDKFIDLFGNGFLIPLADDNPSREKSGTGLTTSLSISASPRLSKKLKLENRLRINIRDFSQTEFDDFYTAIESGLRYQGNRIATSALLTGSKRWFGGDEYSTSYGAKLELTTPLSRRTRFRTRFSYSDVTYVTAPASGPVYAVGTSISHALDKRTFITSDFEITRVQADQERARSTLYQVSVGLQRELPFGITGHVQPLIYLRKHDQEDPIFPQTREDIAYSLSFRITKRDWHFNGFAPALGYSYLNNHSNIDFYSYDQHKVDIGVTRNF